MRRPELESIIRDLTKLASDGSTLDAIKAARVIRNKAEDLQWEYAYQLMTAPGHSEATGQEVALALGVGRSTLYRTIERMHEEYMRPTDDDFFD